MGGMGVELLGEQTNGHTKHGAGAGGGAGAKRRKAGVQHKHERRKASKTAALECGVALRGNRGLTQAGVNHVLRLSAGEAH